MPLTPSQENAALLLSQGSSTAQVAQQLKTSIRSVQRWQKLPEFQERVKSVQKKVTEVAIQNLSASESEHKQQIQQYQTTLYQTTIQSFHLIERSLNIIGERLQSLSPEEISPRQVFSNLKSIMDCADKATILSRQALGIDFLMQLIDKEEVTKE